MFNINDVISIVILILSISMIFLITSKIFFQYIYIEYKIKSADCSLETLLLVLNAAINTELELYEGDVFNNKGAITNSNFENFYMDITNSIMKSLSPTFFVKISYYLNEDVIVSIIARRTKAYLVTKINGTT